MTEPSATVLAYWNAKYRAPIHTDDPEPILRAALAHFGDVRGKRLLDVGCGLGVASVFFAGHGAEVTAIDVSERAIEMLQVVRAENQIGSLRPQVCAAMEAERLGEFDFIFGSMILHHVEPFLQFAEVLGRATAPGGKAFFYENNARSRLLVWFRTHVVGRFGVPKYGDAEESPLEPAEIDMLRPYFEVKIEIPYLGFFRLISTYLLRGRLYRSFLALDRWCYRRGWLHRYSYRQCLLLTKK